MSGPDLRAEKTSDGFQVYYRGRRLYTASGPMTGARRRAASADLTEDTLFLIPSPLLGYGLGELLQRLPSSSHLFCVEVDPALGALAEKPAEQYADADHITFCLPPQLGSGRPLGWQGTAESLVERGYRRVRTITLNGGASLHRENYRKIEGELGEAIQQTWQNRMTTIRLGRVWSRNFLVNLGRTGFAKSASALAESRPIVVVGPSESLEEESAHLASVRDRVAVMALDTALPVLRLRGITADYVVTVDSQRANALDFIGSQPEHLVLIAETTVHPSIPRFAGEERTYWFSSEAFETNLVRRAEAAGLLPLRLPPVGSVAVAALLLALRMTQQKVYLMGIDLAYTPGKPYATGSPLQIEELSTNHRLAPQRMLSLSFRRPLAREKGASGSTVQTDLVLLSYRHQLRTLLAGSSRVFSVGSRGLGVGVPVVPGSQIAEDNVDRSAVPAVQPSARGEEDTSRAERLRRFLSENAEVLRRALESLDSGSGDVLAWDHAWFDFPEAQTARHPGPSFGPRLSLRLKRYGRLLEELLRDPGPGR